MKIGYARVSTQDQNLNLQLEALKREGCEKIFKDIISGSITNRLGLNELKNIVRRGDYVVVWKLDRLAGSLRDLVDLINYFQSTEIGFHSIEYKIDTSNPVGQFTFHIFAAIANLNEILYV